MNPAKLPSVETSVTHQVPASPSDPEDATESKLYTFSNELCCIILGISAVVAAFLTLPLILLALYHIGLGIIFCAKPLIHDGFNASVITSINETNPNNAYVIMILHGLELLLLSCLPYLFIRNLASFVDAWGTGQAADAKTKLEDTKLLLYGIFFGLLSLDFIAKIVSGKIEGATGWIHIVGMLLLGGFVILLEGLSIWKEKALHSSVASVGTPKITGLS